MADINVRFLDNHDYVDRILWSGWVPTVMPPETDPVPPWVDSIYPPASSTISKNETIYLQMHDNSALQNATIWVENYGQWELIYAGTAIGFAPAYSASSVANIVDGWGFELRRGMGWPRTPVFHVLCFDQGGNEAASVITWSYNVEVAVVAEEVETLELTHETAHADKALERLLEQYKQRPRIEALLHALVSSLQPIEDVMWQLYTERWIATAEGAQLDTIGEIVGQPRQGMSDALYKVYISIKVLSNKSTGTIPQIINILSLVGYDTVIIRDFGTAFFICSVTGSATGLARVGLGLLKNVKPGGVGTIFIYSNELSSNTFLFSSYYDSVSDVESNGFSSYYSSPYRGGYLSGVIS